ncbi:nucleotidyltransferase domain-containing protein [Jannaschia donghaensis]|uniref:Uncharacterized protein n=1 Tax=Jannaschia donghaensis TaxID=420998 RepID=A0A0M6YM66_9RHOB|nr:nucleotidyltransferase domain-containing protein [Jannaschia donghaensis]CTQ50994.1 hypothetical protein JDO7802_03028 [Jannaschia donghaensis]
MTHDKTIATIVAATRDVLGLRALFLSGSYGMGTQDAFSDIDFLLVAEEGASDATADLWRKAVARTGEIVLWWDRTNVPVLINAITADWTRTDVVMLKPDQMRGQSRARLKPLFDHDGLYDTLPERLPPAAANPTGFRRQVEEFIRILGLLPLAAGRGEYINGVLGVFHLRNLLVDLMIEETGVPDRGGVLSLNRLLTPEQRAELTGLPPAIADHEAMIAAHLAYAAAYLPRARRRAMAIGADWPDRFEAVTWARLGKTLDLTRPYDLA